MAWDNTFGNGVPADISAWGDELQTTPVRGAIPRAAQVPPFWQYKPPAGIDLYANGTGTLAAGAGSTVDLTFNRAWLTLPGYEGVLQAFVLGVTSPLATLDVTFAVLANGAPVPGWDAFVPPAVAANALLLPFTGPLQLAERIELSVRVTNNSAAGPWTVSGSLAGWQWPRIVRQQVFGEE